MSIYLERTITALRNQGQNIDDHMLQHLSPLGWEHINFTGDYLWPSVKNNGSNKYRPLRSFFKASN